MASSSASRQPKILPGVFLTKKIRSLRNGRLAATSAISSRNA
jgi:hypothetical protein